MKLRSSSVLRPAIVLAGIAMVLICAIAGWIAFFENKPDPYHLEYIWFVGTYLAAVPYFIALYQAMKLLGYIDSGNTFSELSLKALGIIRHCALIVFAVVTLGGLPFFSFLVHLNRDTPGFMILGILISGISLLVAVFASLLKQVFQEGMDIKAS